MLHETYLSNDIWLCRVQFAVENPRKEVRVIRDIEKEAYLRDPPIYQLPTSHSSFHLLKVNLFCSYLESTLTLFQLKSRQHGCLCLFYSKIFLQFIYSYTVQQGMAVPILIPASSPERKECGSFTFRLSYVYLYACTYTEIYLGLNILTLSFPNAAPKQEFECLVCIEEMK